MILVADTETTDMIRWHEPPTHPAQPRVVQLGVGLYQPDGKELAAVSLLIDAGRAVAPGAADVHGISNELLSHAGLKPGGPLRLLEELAGHATLRVAHNTNFDWRMLDMESLLTGIELSRFSQLPSFCTMQATTPICRILKQNPRHSADYKWPKLQEAHYHFFGEFFSGAHDALADVRACARIYFHLQQGNAESRG